jgi:hypothetical protein
MTIQTQRQLKNTKEKLRKLQEQYKQSQERPSANAYTRKLTLQSLVKMINQLKEEISVYQAHAASSSS